MLRHRDRVTTLGSRSQGRARLKVVPTRRGEICGFQPLGFISKSQAADRATLSG